MAFKFKLPDIGEGIHEGEIVKWFAKVGDTIKEDDTLLEVQNDKSVEEIPRHTKAEDAVVQRVVGREEVVAVATVHMTHHDEETGVLQMEIGIYVHNGVVADVHT